MGRVLPRWPYVPDPAWTALAPSLPACGFGGQLPGSAPVLPLQVPWGGAFTSCVTWRARFRERRAASPTGVPATDDKSGDPSAHHGVRTAPERGSLGPACACGTSDQDKTGTLPPVLPVAIVSGNLQRAIALELRTAGSTRLLRARWSALLG